MNKSGKILITACAMGVLVLVSTGCQKSEGPVERAGKQVDQAIDSAGQKIEKAGDKIQDAASDAKK